MKIKIIEQDKISGNTSYNTENENNKTGVKKTSNAGSSTVLVGAIVRTARLAARIGQAETPEGKLAAALTITSSAGVGVVSQMLLQGINRRILDKASSKVFMDDVDTIVSRSNKEGNRIRSLDEIFNDLDVRTNKAKTRSKLKSEVAGAAISLTADLVIASLSSVIEGQRKKKQIGRDNRNQSFSRRLNGVRLSTQF